MPPGFAFLLLVVGAVYLERLGRFVAESLGLEGLCPDMVVGFVVLLVPGAAILIAWVTLKKRAAPMPPGWQSSLPAAEQDLPAKSPPVPSTRTKGATPATTGKPVQPVEHTPVPDMPPPSRGPDRGPAIGAIRWVGSGEAISVGDMRLLSPMVYFAEDRVRAYCQEPEAIDTTLPITEDVNTPPSADGPGGPHYGRLTPRQRRDYLAWLAGARHQRPTEMVHPILFLFGLERRALVEGRDRQWAFDELLRLRGMCKDQQGPLAVQFDACTRGLLRYLLLQTPELFTASQVGQLLGTIQGLAEDDWAAILFWFASQEEPLPRAIAFHLAKCQPQSLPMSKLSHQLTPEFLVLFAQQYERQYGQGLVLRLPSQSQSFTYRPANPAVPSMPLHIASPMRLPSQFLPLSEIWNLSLRSCLAGFRPLMSQEPVTVQPASSPASGQPIPPPPPAPPSDKQSPPAAGTEATSHAAASRHPQADQPPKVLLGGTESRTDPAVPPPTGVPRKQDVSMNRRKGSAREPRWQLAGFASLTRQAIVPPLMAGNFKMFVSQNTASDRDVVVTAGKAAAVLGLPGSGILSHSDSSKLCKMAECIGYCVEPDARIMQAAYRSEDRIALFAGVQDQSQEATAYVSAACMFRIGMMVATADGRATDRAVSMLVDRIQATFDLNEHHKRRLKALRWVLADEAADVSLVRDMVRHLTNHHRRAAVDLIEAIAGADGAISPRMQRVVQSVYGDLGISPREPDQVSRLPATDASGSAPVQPASRPVPAEGKAPSVSGASPPAAQDVAMPAEAKRAGAGQGSDHAVGIPSSPERAAVTVAKPSPAGSPSPVPDATAFSSGGPGCHWVGRDQQVRVADLLIQSPMSYFTDSRRVSGSAEHAAIDTALPVATDPQAAQSKPLPDWPRYNQLTPGQRRSYLAWLADGRRQRPAEIGYALLFLFGLERRALAEHLDQAWVFDEVLRLRSMYTDSPKDLGSSLFDLCPPAIATSWD